MNSRRSHHHAVRSATRARLARLIPLCLLGSLLSVALQAAESAAPEETSSSPPAQGDDDSRPKETRKKKAAEEKPSAGKPGPAGSAAGSVPAERPPLRFTDLDLEKYHRRVQEEAQETEGPGEHPAEASPTPVPGPAAPIAPASPGARKAPPARRPRNLAPPPPPDPLKAFKERQARERFRAKQIQDLRDTIAGMESRLQYLKTKREALLNPAAPLQVGRTRGPDDPPDPVPGPGKVPIQKEPTPPGKVPPSVFPGAGRLAIAPLFPALPEPQTDEDRENDKRMKVRDLLAQVEKEIEGLEVELEETRTVLVDIETRFGAEAGIR